MVIVHVVSDSLAHFRPNGRERFPLAWTPLRKEWFGAEVPSPPQYQIALTSDALIFAGGRNVAPHCTPRAAGSFVEGLWEEEVGELFLCAPEGSRYLEVNLAPSGAWWWCLFDSYRIRAKSQPTAPPRAEALATQSAESWRSELILPLSDLPFELRPRGSFRANVSFVLPGVPVQYVTATPLLSEKPDFHLSTQFLAVDSREVGLPTPHRASGGR